MQIHGGDIYRYPNFIDFSANINFLGAPDSVIKAVTQAVNQVMHYPQVGCSQLRKAIAGLEQMDSEMIICGNGAAEILYSLVLAKKPKKALLAVPVFQEYEQALSSVDCEICYYICKEENSFQPQEDFLEAVDGTLDMVFFCNPNNPTGMLAERDYLKRLLERCEQYQVLLVLDECFLDFILSAEDTTMKPFLNSSQLFLLKAFTKIFAIPGLRLGYGLSQDRELLEKMQSVTQPWNVSVLAQAAGIAAAGETQFLSETRQALELEKTYLLGQLKQWNPKAQFPIKVLGHAANFIFVKSSQSLGQTLLERKIVLRDCSNFRGLSKGWYRIAVRTRQENERFLEALHRINRQ